MSNIVPFTRPKTAPTESKPMTEAERTALQHSLGRLAHSHPFPLSTLLNKLAITVRDYPLEDVALKDLAPKGFALTANYPNFGLHWVFRIDEKIDRRKGLPMADDILMGMIQRGSKMLCDTTYGARFAYRFLVDLGKVVQVSHVEFGDGSMTVSGQIQHDEFPINAIRRYRQFQMTLTRH